MLLLAVVQFLSSVYFTPSMVTTFDCFIVPKSTSISGRSHDGCPFDFWRNSLLQGCCFRSWLRRRCELCDPTWRSHCLCDHWHGWPSSLLSVLSPVFKMSCQSGCNSGHVCPFPLCDAGSFKKCLEVCLLSHNILLGPDCILQLSQHCSCREYVLWLFLRVCRGCCCWFCCWSYCGYCCYPKSQRTPRTCWGCRTRRFRWPGWSSLRCWQYQRTCLLAYHFPALVRSEELPLVWRGLFEGRIAISWTVDFLMVLGGPNSTALASDERFTNANFFTMLRPPRLRELLLLDLRLTTLRYHAKQLWIMFVLWAQM